MAKAPVDVNALTEHHPYVYGRALAFFHAFAIYPGAISPQGDHMDFVFVRWFRQTPGHEAGWKQKQLDRLTFLPSTSEGAFDFLDPSLIIRGSHIIPAYEQGQTTALLPNSMYRELEGDWNAYYANRYVLH